jgi:TolB-like protein/Flp pilus assembly protein TadD
LSLFNELKRRNVFKVGIAYVVVAWLVAQVLQLIFESFGTPDWVMKTVLVLLATGLPFALFFAWAFEMTPGGLKRESEVDRTQSITPQTGKKLNTVIFAVMGLAIAYFTYDKFVLTAGRDAALIEATTQAVSEQAATEEASTESDKSIAVLPFVNMSDDASNEYFSDGLSEELLNMLVKIPELRVAARTSSFSFKDKDLKISEIAQELNVSHVLEGSVRKFGDKVRITAQLIKAEDGFHLWSETYDRELDDIFVVQDEIASKVANALQVTLLGQSRSEREVDPEAYELWLKGLYFLNQRGEENYKKSEEVLLQAIELEPDYVAAWELVAMTYYVQTTQHIRTREEGYALAMNAINRAISLDPDQGVTLAAYGFLKKNLDWDWETAQMALTRAHQLEPNSNIIRIWRASLMQTLGRLDEAVENYKQALAVDPLNLSPYSSLGINYRKVHRFEDAIAVFKKQIELRPDYYWAHFNLGKTYLFKGDPEQALVEIENNPSNIFRELGLVLVYTTLGREAEAQAVLQRLVAQEGEQSPVWIAEAFGWRGEKDQAFEWLEKAYVQKDVGLAYLLGNAVFKSLWDDPRWVELLQKLNLLEYWQDMPPEYGGPARPAG